MRAGQRHVQEALRIEHRKLAFHEQVLDDFQPDLGRPGAVRVPAHAVKNHHERGIVGDDHGCTVLVVRAITKSGHFCVFDFHQLNQSRSRDSGVV